jgi:hypothetical protein
VERYFEKREETMTYEHTHKCSMELMKEIIRAGKTLPVKLDYPQDSAEQHARYLRTVYELLAEFFLTYDP